MQTLRLQRPVTITGLNYWGRMSKLTFSPHPNVKPGWWWSVSGDLVPITVGIVKTAKRRIMLQVAGQRLHVWEHIGALRFSGLDSVVVEGTGWPPYDGGSGLYWSTLRSALISTGENISWKPVLQQSYFEYGNNRSTTIVPAEDGMEIDVHIDYPGLGETAVKFSLPTDLQWLLQEIFITRSQGWPKWPYEIMQLLEMIGRPLYLPHLRPSQMTWPQVVSKEVALEQFALHRILDVLGAVSLVYHEALPACRVFSHCSGHFGDIEAIKKLQ